MTNISTHERVELWLRRLAQHAASGESVAEFCSREGISTVSFYQWKRRLVAQCRDVGAFLAKPDCEPKAMPGFTQLIVNHAAAIQTALGDITKSYIL